MKNLCPLKFNVESSTDEDYYQCHKQDCAWWCNTGIDNYGCAIKVLAISVYNKNN